MEGIKIKKEPVLSAAHAEYFAERQKRKEAAEALKAYYEMEPHVSDEGDPYEDLALGIIMNAVSDWRNARRILDRRLWNRQAREMLMDCEEFFRSKWFTRLCGMNGEDMIRRLRVQDEEFISRMKSTSAQKTMLERLTMTIEECDRKENNK